MSFFLRKASLLTLAIFAGCASTHNLKTMGSSVLGGGFTDDELRPGLYRMTARSNMAIWPSFAAASATWKSRADELCGKDAYQTFDTTINEGRAQSFPLALSPGVVVSAANYNATISGYLLCRSASWSVDQARSFLQAEQAREEQKTNESVNAKLAQLGGGDCGLIQAEVSAETYFHRGKMLMGLEKYTAARSCFIRAQEVGAESDYFYRESCQSLGLLYEVGLGVEKDSQAAHAWYRKAGL